jgi:hypothetical protein
LTLLNAPARRVFSHDPTDEMAEVPMSDKLDELSSEIDDAVRSTEELQDEPGGIQHKQLEKVKHALDKAQDGVSDIEQAED